MQYYILKYFEHLFIYFDSKHISISKHIRRLANVSFGVPEAILVIGDTNIDIQKSDNIKFLSRTYS